MCKSPERYALNYIEKEKRRWIYGILLLAASVSEVCEDEAAAGAAGAAGGGGEP